MNSKMKQLNSNYHLRQSLHLKILFLFIESLYSLLSQYLTRITLQCTNKAQEYRLSNKQSIAIVLVKSLVNIPQSILKLYIGLH